VAKVPVMSPNLDTSAVSRCPRRVPVIAGLT
jgi:hypothetical protein